MGVSFRSGGARWWRLALIHGDDHHHLRGGLTPSPFTATPALPRLGVCISGPQAKGGGCKARRCSGAARTATRRGPARAPGLGTGADGPRRLTRRQCGRGAAGDDDPPLAGACRQAPRPRARQGRGASALASGGVRSAEVGGPRTACGRGGSVQARRRGAAGREGVCERGWATARGCVERRSRGNNNRPPPVSNRCRRGRGRGG